MATTVDATVEKVLDQAFSSNHEAYMHASVRSSAANDAVAELARNIFLGEIQKVGTREAAAMQRMDDNKLAQAILAQRAVADQPPNK